MRTHILTLLALLLLHATVRAGDPRPTSHESPEGVAADLVQAFISRDFDVFNEARAKDFCEGKTDPVNYYVDFRNSTTLFLNGAPLHEPGFPSRLMRISRVYAARPLVTKEQLSIARAFVGNGWLEPTLVDVVVEDRLGNELLHRTLVVKGRKAGLWYGKPKLFAHDYLVELLQKLPESESVYWQITPGPKRGD